MKGIINCEDCIYYNKIIKKCECGIEFPVKKCGNYTSRVILNPNKYKRDLPKICETCTYYMMDGYCCIEKSHVLGKSICDKYEQADYNQVDNTGRFKEVLSTQKIIDNDTGKEYDGLVSEDLLKLINELDKTLNIFKEQHGQVLDKIFDKCKITIGLQDAIISIHNKDLDKAESILMKLIGDL